MNNPLWPRCTLCRDPIMEEGTTGVAKYHRSCQSIYRPIYKRLYNAHYAKHGRPLPDELDAIKQQALKQAQREYALAEIAKISES